MATIVRPELSVKNKYHLNKHRYYELKHFCLQYIDWKRTYTELLDLGISISSFERIQKGNAHADLTAKYAMRKAYYAERIKMVETAAKNADEDLYLYILKAVTEGLSYNHLKSKLQIPCSRDTYYDRYRRFFWLLSEARD